jgi:molecular chaperone DnaJ
MSDPYAVLGVSRDASPDEIKKAYRELVKKYHPDLHPGDESAAKKMSEVNAAYDMIKSGKDSSGRPAGQADSYSSSAGGSAYSYGNPFDGFGFYGGFSERSYSALEMAELLIRSRRYYDAQRILAGISYRDGRWHYLSALADFALGNRTSAMQNIRRAVELEPDNRDYVSAMEAMENGRQVYSQNENVGLKIIKLFFRIIIFFQVIQLIFMLLGGAGFFGYR